MWSQLEVKFSGWEITQIFALPCDKSVLYMLCCDAPVGNSEKCAWWPHCPNSRRCRRFRHSVSFHTHFYNQLCSQLTSLSRFLPFACSTNIMRSYRLKGPGYESCVYHCYVQLPSQLGIRFGWIPSWQLSLKYSNSATELPSDLVAQLKHISGHLPGCGRFESIPESLSFSHLFLFHLYFSPFFL